LFNTKKAVKEGQIVKKDRRHIGNLRQVFGKISPFCSHVILVKRELKIYNKQDSLLNLWTKVKMKCRVPV